jgi:hypothetical protein
MSTKDPAAQRGTKSADAAFNVGSALISVDQVLSAMYTAEAVVMDEAATNKRLANAFPVLQLAEEKLETLRKDLEEALPTASRASDNADRERNLRLIDSLASRMGESRPDGLSREQIDRIDRRLQERRDQIFLASNLTTIAARSFDDTNIEILKTLEHIADILIDVANVLTVDEIVPSSEREAQEVDRG